jgi:hypothetical protein
MNHLHDLFASPDLYPLKVDFGRQRVTFARISQEGYRHIVALSAEAAKRRSDNLYDIRLDDALLAASGAPRVATRVHYILHTAYCCSTLLARYFELLSCCFVLKEPEVLARLAMVFNRSTPRWHEAFDLCLRLLSRTYASREVVVIKAHVPVNILGNQLLERNPDTTITFLMTPLRQFLLAVLKSEERRNRVREWIRYTVCAEACPALTKINPNNLNDIEATAYWWVLNRLLCRDLSSGAAAGRVVVVNGEELADSPESTLKTIVAKCVLPVNADELKLLVDHPSVRKYSKNLSRPYDATSRRQEIADLERRWHREVEAGVEWAASFGVGVDVS